MRIIGVFQKCLWEQPRSLLILSMTLLFGPLIVFLYGLFFPSGSTTYEILLLNQGAGEHAAVSQLVEALETITYSDDQPLLVVQPVDTRAEAEARLRDRSAEMLLILPANFADGVEAVRQGRAAAAEALTFVGDLTNPYYAVAVVMVSAALDQYTQQITGVERTLPVVEEALGGSAARTEFETYVPGLLIFAVISLVFLASMTIAREVESGTLRRLQTTGMTGLDFLAGTSMALILIALAAVLLTFLTALALGFRSQGPLWVGILVAVLTSFSVIGTGLLVACFTRSAMQAAVLANFPLAIYMFFSGAIFPIPRVALFSLGGHIVGLYDILPPTHAVTALNKVFTLGLGMGDVTFELAALALLSAGYFALGVWLFNRRHLRAM